MRFLKLYGLERSGTNYLEWLLRKNFPELCVLVDETGWKHGAVPAAVDWSGRDWTDPEWDAARTRLYLRRLMARIGSSLEPLQAAVADGEMMFCFISKNPYSWYASFARYRQMPYSPVNPRFVERWCALNRHWRAFSRERADASLFLRYEDLIEDADRHMTQIAEHLRLPRSEHKTLSCHFRMTMSGYPHSSPFDLGYYLEKRYLEAFSASDLRNFAEHLQPDLLRDLGYELEAPPHSPDALPESLNASW